MLNMNREEALREVFARQGALQMMAQAEPYNTGASSTTRNAVEYINLWLLGRYLSTWAPGPENQAQHDFGLIGTRFVLSTGAAEYRMNTVRCSTNEPSQTAPDNALVVNEGFATPANIVSTIRRAFMLSVRDTAAVFRVTRPTIYQWQTLTDLTLIRAHEDRNRMKTLYQLALVWAREGPLPGNWLTQPLAATGQSVLDLLSSEKLDVEAVRNARTILQAAVKDLAGAEHERSRRAAEGLARAIGRMAEHEERRRKRP